MSFQKNYQDYLQPCVEDILSAGFKDKYPKHKCGTVYYVNKACDYALAHVESYGWVLIDRETYESIGDITINMNSKKQWQYYVPYVVINNKNIALHRHVMNADEDVLIDHKNHNRYCCIKENLRCCNYSQNALNSRRRKIDIGEDAYDSKVDYYLKRRDVARDLYKGTVDEDFVYDIENDFSGTLGLLIHYYILNDITKEEMYELNLEYWRNKLDNAPAIEKAV